MNFKEIKKILLNPTPFPKLPEKEKEIAKKIIFIGMVSFFIFVALASYVLSPSNFFHDSSNKLEILGFFAWFIYFFTRLYNGIQDISTSQVLVKINENSPINSRKIVRSFILNTILPSIALLIYFIIRHR